MKIRCPIPQCGNENSLDDVRCPACGTNLQAYHRALMFPNDLFNRGLSLSQNGRFQQAEQCLQVAVLFNSRDVEAMLLLAHVQLLQEHLAAATSTLDRVLEKENHDSRLETILAVLQQILAGSQDVVSLPVIATKTPLPVKATPVNQSKKQSASKPPSSQSGSKQQKQKKKRR